MFSITPNTLILFTMIIYLGGMILIGDVGFETRAELEKLREREGDAFDDEEFYFAAEQFRDAFPSLRFEQKSVCGGIITIERI